MLPLLLFEILPLAQLLAAVTSEGSEESEESEDEGDDSSLFSAVQMLTSLLLLLWIARCTVHKPILAGGDQCEAAFDELGSFAELVLLVVADGLLIVV